MIAGGFARGSAVVANQPLSFWGGVDPATGEVIDRRHPLTGAILAGTILVIPHERGSCSASGVLLECIRNKTAPAGIIVSRVDPIIGLGSILGEEPYQRGVPVAVIAEHERLSIRAGDDAEFDESGQIAIHRRQ